MRFPSTSPGRRSGGGGGSSGDDDTPRRPRLPEFDGIDVDEGGLDVGGVDDATFTNPTQGLEEIDDDLADLGGR